MKKPSQQLISATYNIRLGIQEGVEAIADVLLSCGPPDLIALQEIGNDWIMGPPGDTLTALADSLNLPHQIGNYPLETTNDAGGRARYGHGVLSRWPITQFQTIDLPQLEDEPRALTVGEIESPVGPLEIYSTHLSHILPDRPVQGAFLNQFLNDRPPAAHRLLMGDLNACDDEEWLNRLLVDWKDADEIRRRPTFPAHSPKRRIDYILGQGLRIDEVAVIEDDKASDHRPLMARWSIITT